MTSLTPSGPINASSGQVISGLRISNPSGPCITVVGVANVRIVDSEIGPCGGGQADYGNANIKTANATNLTIEYTRIFGGDNRAFIAQGGSNIVFRKNVVSGAFNGPFLVGGIEFDYVDGGTAQDNFVLASFAGDSISMYESSNMRNVGNYLDVSTSHQHSAGFTMGDSTTGNPGRNNYVAGNYVKQSGGVPAGVFGSSGNTVVENNLFTGGMQAFNYSGIFVGVTVRRNAIGPGSYIRDSSLLSEFETNVFRPAVSTADVPGGLGYRERDGTWVNTQLP